MPLDRRAFVAGAAAAAAAPARLVAASPPGPDEGAERSIASFAAPARGDGSDATEAVQAAMDWASARGGRAVITFPPGGFRLSRPFPLTASNLVLRGAGKDVTVIIPTFGGCPFPLGAPGGKPVEGARVTDMSFASDFKDGRGWAFEFGSSTRSGYERVRAYSFFGLVRFGTPDLPLENPGLGRLVDCEGGCTGGDGIVMYAGASLVTEGVCLFDGRRGTGGRGLAILGPMDGLFLSKDTVIKDFDTSVKIVHTRGSVANIELGCNFTTPLDAFIDIDLSGTASLNNLLVAGARFFDRQSDGHADFLKVGNAGSQPIHSITVQDVEIRNLRRRVAVLNAVVDNLSLRNVDSLWGGAEANNAWDAIDGGGLAHGRVHIEACNFNGDAKRGVFHRYGLSNLHAVRAMDLNGIDVGDAASGPVHNLGPLNADRHAQGIVGM
jgi:hypothetical protein